MGNHTEVALTVVLWVYVVGIIFTTLVFTSISDNDREGDPKKELRTLLLMWLVSPYLIYLGFSHLYHRLTSK